jgi:hypothetical protein
VVLSFSLSIVSFLYYLFKFKSAFLELEYLLFSSSLGMSISGLEFNIPTWGSVLGSISDTYSSLYRHTFHVIKQIMTFAEGWMGEWLSTSSSSSSLRYSCLAAASSRGFPRFSLVRSKLFLPGPCRLRCLLSHLILSNDPWK